MDSLKALYLPKVSRYPKQPEKITLEEQPSENYSFGGAFTLVDGITETKSNWEKHGSVFMEKMWWQLLISDRKPVFRSLFQYFDNKGSWIHFAKSAQIFVSDNGTDFKLIKEIGKEEILSAKGKLK
jgi:hexosaminidase